MARGCSANHSSSARWRILTNQLTLLGQYPTPAVARGSSYPNKRKLRSGRAGRPYAGQARPKGVLLAIRARKLCKRKPSPRVPSGTRTKEKTPRTKPTKPAEKPTNPQKTPRKTFSPTKTANNATIRFIFTQIRPFRYAICSRKRCQKIRNHACHPLCPLARGTKYVENAHHEKSREPTTEPR